MGQYKVPQNVEAEDKILGPLTFRQFIYALIGVGWGLLCFAIFRKVPAVMILVGFPPSMLFLLLAFYTRDGQNFEQLLIAMVGFFAAPRKRLWVKEAVAETFHVEAAKVVVEQTQRNPAEVRSELEKLANLIDSRGWNRRPDLESEQILPTTQVQDRIAPPPPAPRPPDEPKSDMLDLQKSPLAQNLAQLLAEAAEDVREEAMNQMNQHPGRRNAPTALAMAQANISGVTGAPAGDILKLATQSDDLTVSQLAAQATRMAPMPQQPTQLPQPQDQVVDGGYNGR